MVSNVETDVLSLQALPFIQQVVVDTLGGWQPSHNVEKLSESLYRVSVAVDIKSQVEQQGWQLAITPDFDGDFQWAPHITPTDKHIISDHVFRAPAMIWASADKILTVIPDLDERAKSSYRWFMDLDVPRKKLILGLSDYAVKEHVLFHKTESTTFKAGKISISFFVMVSEDQQDIANPWRGPLAFLWDKHGKALSDQGEPLNMPLKPFCDDTYNWAFNTWEDAVWQEFDLDGKRVGAPVFIVTIAQSPNYPEPHSEREFTSIWNNAWFNSLRSASGLYRYAKRTGNKEYERRALMTKELALSFPQNNGFFPGLIATEMHEVEIDGKTYTRSKGWDSAYFANSNRNPVSIDPKESPLNIVDMSWTAYLMLMWYEELEKDPRLLEYATKFATGLLSIQADNGMFPHWINDDGSALGTLDDAPGASMSVTFLLKMFKLTGEQKYKVAALRAMDFVLEEIVPIGRWEDFETYWSCCTWGNTEYVGKKVERNNMFKQNTLAIYWTAEALLEAYETTQEPKYLQAGQRTLDELLMTQAVWQPPYMYVKVFGGFGVMNADAEWNDSRQALFAELIIRYGKLLNNDEYVARGVAALKASFNMIYSSGNPKAKSEWEARFSFFDEKDYGFMMENYGHDGYTSADGVGIGSSNDLNVFTIYDWGNGAACEGYNRVLDRFGEDLLKPVE